MMIWGVTWAATGKLAGSVGKITLGAEPSVETIPTDAGCAALNYTPASFVPDASGVGSRSTPSPVESWCGVPPDVDTAQMWRRSMSPALVEEESGLASGGGATAGA